jgi:hypothetical protein
MITARTARSCDSDVIHMAEICFARSGIATSGWQSLFQISRDAGPMLEFAKQSLQWLLRLSGLRPIRWRASIWDLGDLSSVDL